MRASTAFAIALTVLAARTSFGAGSVEVRSASPETFAAVQSLIQGPGIEGLAADAPGLALVRTMRSDSAADLAAMGLLAAYLPGDFPARAAAAAAGDASARESAVAALRRAYADAAPAAPSVIEARAKSIKRGLLSRRLSPESWRAASDGLASYAMFGEKAQASLADWRRWTANQTGRAALMTARAGQAALADGAAEGADGETASSAEAPAAPSAAVVSLTKFRDHPTAAAASLRGPGIVVPAGTRVVLDLMTPADSGSARHRDSLIYELAADVLVGGQRVLSKGTMAHGVVRRVRRSGLVGKAGYIEAHPTELVTESGVKIPLKGDGDRSEPSDTKSLFLATAQLLTFFLLDRFVVHASLGPMIGILVATMMVYFLVPGFKARLRPRIAAYTAKEAAVRADDAA